MTTETRAAIEAERAKQDAKWGEQNHADEWWLAIATEELGEVSQAILHDKFGGDHAGTAREELVQLTSVCVAWIECIDRRAAKQRDLDGVMGNELKPIGHSSWNGRDAWEKL